MTNTMKIFLDTLREKADIVDVVAGTTALKRTRSWLNSTYTGLCPFHGEKTPSFMVDRKRGFFHCFGCGIDGDVIGFVALTQHRTWTGAVRHVAACYGVEIPPDVDAELARMAAAK